MRTFSKDAWDAAQRAWYDGEFSDEWRDVRHQAAMRGMAYPPAGTRFDSWSDDQPSQRAILIRAIRETPQLLEQAVARSSNWGQVVARITAHLNEYRDDLEREERLDRRQRHDDEPNPREATVALKHILDRITAS